MGVYNIGFLIFCVVMALFVFIGISKNALTKYGAGLLIGVLVFGIIGYDIWANIQFQEVLRKIDLTDSDTEKQILLQNLMKNFGTRP
jgi:hypothetical protein